MRQYLITVVILLFTNSSISFNMENKTEINHNNKKRVHFVQQDGYGFANEQAYKFWKRFIENPDAEEFQIGYSKQKNEKCNKINNNNKVIHNNKQIYRFNNNNTKPLDTTHNANKINNTELTVVNNSNREIKESNDINNSFNNTLKPVNVKENNENENKSGNYYHSLLDMPYDFAYEIQHRKNVGPKNVEN